MSETTKPIKTHGTHSGYQAHRHRGEDPCPACRAARREYMAQYMARYRATHEEKYEQEKRMNAARSRAVWRLAEAHPDEFRAYFDEERAPKD